MEFNEAKKELESYNAMEMTITQLESWIDDKKQKANKLSATLSSEPKSSSKQPDMMAEKLTTVLGLESDITERINHMKSKQEAILNKLLKVEQPYQNVFFSIYIVGNTMEEASFNVGYSRTQIYKKRDKGVEMYACL